MERILVVAAHPDDEVLGCGGTLARHAGNGDTVDVLFLADGVGAREGSLDMEIVSRRVFAGTAADALGINQPRFLKFPDQRLDTLALLDVVQAIETVMAEVDPTTVYTHHGGDLNLDHRITHDATLTACRPLPGRALSRVLAFEVPSSTEWSPRETFRPTHFVDVSETLDAKRAALACYEAEMRPAPHPRSAEAIAALGTWRGASAGLDHAEAFEVLRQIER